MKELMICLLFLLIAGAGERVYAQSDTPAAVPWLAHGRLSVSASDPHYLSFADGTPFFWIGDTGWELIHLLTRAETRYYFKVRKQQGFNVIQAVLLSEFGGLTIPNAYGKLPFTDAIHAIPAVTPAGGNHQRREVGMRRLARDPMNSYSYWDHVDFVVSEAEKAGLFLALLPCWGEYVTPREGKALFTDTRHVYKYGHFLGVRYRAKKNILWILGGDRRPDESPTGATLWRYMAKGIADGSNGIDSIDGPTDYSTTFMTFHCSVSSSTWFQQDKWLDMDMWGSYHDNFNKTKAFEQVYADDSLSVIKPTLNGEPAYEEHPVNWLSGNGAFTSYDVRQIAYWSVLAGACGHTYGCNPVWQFYDPKKRTGNFLAHTPWETALFDEGATQMIYLKDLIYSRPMLHRIAANDIISEGQGMGGDHCVAALGEGYAFIYLPTGGPVTISLAKVGRRKVRAWWYDPRTGAATAIGEYQADVPAHFAPPGISEKLAWLRSGRGCDWVLVLDDADRAFGPPGMVRPVQFNSRP